MQSLCLTISSPKFHHNFSSFTSSSTSIFNPYRLTENKQKLMMHKKKSGMGSSAVSSISSTTRSLLSPHNLQWVAAVSSAVLMLVKGTTINRSFLVPFFALTAPASVMSWMQGEYGAWTACLTLLARLFFFIPGELELPFMTLVLVLVAPRQAMNLRGTREGILISVVIGAFIAFQHFTGIGSLQRSVDQVSIVSTIAAICTVVAPCLLLF